MWIKMQYAFQDPESTNVVCKWQKQSLFVTYFDRENDTLTTMKHQSILYEDLFIIAKLAKWF